MSMSVRLVTYSGMAVGAFFSSTAPGCVTLSLGGRWWVRNTMALGPPGNGPTRAATEQIRIEHKMSFDFRGDHGRGECERDPAQGITRGLRIGGFGRGDQCRHRPDQAPNSEESKLGEGVECHHGAAFDAEQRARVAAKSWHDFEPSLGVSRQFSGR